MLTISPTNGVSGTLRSQSGATTSPWNAYRSQIKRIYAEPGTKPDNYSLRLFSGLNQCTEIDLHNMDVSGVRVFSYMFENCSKLQTLNISGWQANCADAELNSMCYGCSSLKFFSGLTATRPKSLGRMFHSCSLLSSIDLSGIRTASVTGMEGMFYQCKSIKSLDLSDWDVRNVTTTYQMFSGTGLVSLDLSGWNLQRLTTMRDMFRNSEKLVSLDTAGWNVSNVLNMNFVFGGCTSLVELDLSDWVTTNVTNTDSMFYGCTKLEKLDISGFDTASDTASSRMFGSCSKLKEVKLGQSFDFKGSIALPNPSGSKYTGKWIREDEVYGPYTPNELKTEFVGSQMAGVWVWEEKPTMYTVKFMADASVAGAMPPEKYLPGEEIYLPSCAYYRFNFHFDHWEGSDGNTYPDRASIPANTFEPGYTLQLTAVMEQDNNDLVFTDGEADVYLIGGEQIEISALPGGTGYQIWEETPSGRQLVEQVNPAGTVPPNGRADASFTNEYIPGTATIQLIAAKTLDGRIPADGAFRFELLNHDDEVIETAANSGTGVVMFETLVFRQPGEFDYKIREVRGDDPGINYDVHRETVHISVTDDGVGNLTASASYDADGAKFENETKPGSLTVTKETAGSGNPNEIFTFQVRITDDFWRSLDSVQVVQPAA